MKNLLLIGFGDIAQSEHMKAIKANSDFNLCGIVEIDAERIRIAQSQGFPVFPDIAAALETKPEAAIITTPPHITPIVAIQALKSGLHILLEKPIADSASDLNELKHVAESSDRIIQVGFVNRFSPFMIEVRNLLSNNSLGSPLVINMGAFDEILDESNIPHLEKIISFLEHGSAFAHEGTHLLDYLRFLNFGNPVAIYAKGVSTDKRFPAPNYVHVNLGFEDGSIANLEVGWLFPHLPRGYIRIMGPKGRIEIIRRLGEMTIEIEGARETRTLQKPWNEITFAAQLAAFKDSIDGKESFASELADGLWNVEMIQRLESSLGF